MINNHRHRIKYRLKGLINKALNAFSRGAERPVYLPQSGSGLRVHLGAGPINLQGWVNVDARPAPHIHLTTEGFSLKEFSDDGVSEIYMCHVLEHFSFVEVDKVLLNLKKKLCSGGTLRLSVPDFDLLSVVYDANGKNLELIKMALMGGQDYEYNFHKSIYNERLLKNLLESLGFIDVVSWTAKEDFGVDLGDWSDKNFITPSSTIPISLNIKAIKP